MMRNVALFIEAVTVLICINKLYGERFKLDIKAVIFIALDILLVQLRREGVISQWWNVMFYGMVVGYCVLKFGYNNLRELGINFFMNLIIQSVLQAFSFMLLQVFHVMDNVSTEVDTVLIMTTALLFTWGISVKGTLHKMSLFMQQKFAVIRTLMIVAVVLIGYMMVVVKAYGQLKPQHYVVITISLVLLFAITYLWQRTQDKVKEQQMVLMLREQYNESYSELITSIRGKQHDFTNHLLTIESMGVMYPDQKELLERQSVYIASLKEENRYSKLLRLNDTVLAGFLFSKFQEIERHGVRVDFKLEVANMNCVVPDYKLVEMLGNLLDNALEAVEHKDLAQTLCVKAENREKEILFSVSNECEHMTHQMVSKMFTRGISSKGNNRGHGLANILQICQKYECELQVENLKEQGKSYIQFTLHLRK